MFHFVETPFPVYVSTIDDASVWHDFFAENAATHGIGVDTETTGLDIVRDRIRFFSLATEHARICAPVRLLPVFEDILEDPYTEKHLTNAKYDMHLLANHGVHLRGHILDTADMDFVIDENRQGRHGLKDCAHDYLGLRMTPFRDVFGNARSTNDEVRTLCEIHDILEMHDDEGDPVSAAKWARDVLFRLDRVAAPPATLKAVQRLHLSLRADRCTLTAKQVVAIAEQLGVVEQHSGKHRHVSELLAILGNYGEVPVADRKGLLEAVDQESLLREATEIVYENLMERTGVSKDPVAFLREQVGDYSSLDAWASDRLVGVMRERLVHPDMVMVTEEVRSRREAPELLLQHVEDNRVPFIQTLWLMERRGFRIDVDQTQQYATVMQEEVDRIERELVRVTGDLHFNPSSVPQLLAMFFKRDEDGAWLDIFGDPPKKMTSGGESGVKMPSTNRETLEHFAGKGDDRARLILEYRNMQKLLDTYMVGLPRFVDRNRRIHTSLKSTGARTWRISSADPNLQNIPVKDEVWGKRIRKVFVAGTYGDCSPDLCSDAVRDVAPPDLPPDTPMRLIVADYKQLEMCILAHFSGDENMIDAIIRKQDLHCRTVSLAAPLGISGLPRDVTYEQAKAAKDASGRHGYTMTPFEALLARARSNLKSTGFGIVYGIGEVKLGMQLGLQIVKRPVRNKSGVFRDACPEAAELIENYLHSIFPGVGEFIESTKDQCREELVVYTVAGHPRRLPDIISSNRKFSSQAERQAPNSIIQGSAADIVIKAMLRCERDKKLRRLGCRQLLQVHDELIFEVPDIPEFYEEAQVHIRANMENPYPMRVPILVDMDTGYTWGDAKG